MSREFDEIRKKIDQSHKDLYKQDSEIIRDIDSINKNQEKTLKEINDIKKEIKNIASKIDTMLEILNNFSMMLVEDDEDLADSYYEDEDNESWVSPEQDEDWNTYEDDDSDLT